LWLKNELLHPVDCGGRIRTYNMLRQLRRDHEVTYVALDDGASPPDTDALAQEYCHRLVRVPVPDSRRGSARFYRGVAQSLFSPLPYVLWKARAAGMRRAVAEAVARGEVDVLVCDFLFPSVNVPRRPGVPALLFEHNVESTIWRRSWENAANPAARAYLWLQWRRMVRAERRQCLRFDAVVAVSGKDREALERLYGARRVRAVATGVDVDFFRPGGSVAREPHGLVFTGAMDWLPNEDGIFHFAEAILPLVRREVEDATLTVVGRRPSARLLALAARHPWIRITGPVPDVRPYLEAAAVFVVPLRIGSGTRLKIFEAMAMEKPVVSTGVGAEGLPVEDGRELHLADAPEDFADAVVRLLREPARAEAMGRGAAELVRSRFSWSGIARDFAAICEELRPTPAVVAPSPALLRNAP
jgi:glycosyltransferase involved in cell wall biosynthesis